MKLIRYAPTTALGLVAVALLGLTTTGCPNVANLTTARVLQPGTTEFTVAPAAVGISSALFDANEDGVLMGGTVDLGFRAGISDNVDLGARLSNFGNVNFDVKVGLLDDRNFRVALDPTIGGVFLAAGGVSAGYFQLDIPVLLDLALNDHITFNIGPRYTLLGFFAGAPGGAASSMQHLMGTTFGIELAFGDSFAIQPHAGIMHWVNSPTGVNANFYTVGLAFKFIGGGSRFGGHEPPPY